VGQQTTVVGHVVAAEPSAGADLAADSDTAPDDQQGEIMNLGKGYGFIRRDGGENLFFHMTSLIDVSFPELHAGQRVAFVERTTARGQVAQQVRAIGP
jgi:cold shock CspA family protein